MLAWLKNFADAWRRTFEPSKITEDMVYDVIPTTWIKKMSIRKLLLDKHPELTDWTISDAAIYSHLMKLDFQGKIECSIRRFPKMHYDQGICRKKTPKNPNARNEIATELALA